MAETKMDRSCQESSQNVYPRLIDFPQEQAMAGALLASCYERQNKLDLALRYVYPGSRQVSVL